MLKGFFKPYVMTMGFAMMLLFGCSIGAPPPDTPTDPPADTTEPDTPDTPDEPDTPDTPDTPDEPDTPDTPDTPTDPTPVPPPTGAGITWNFDSPTDGATNCGGGVCPWPTATNVQCRFSIPSDAIGCYRTHYYDPDAGVNGTGAIVMHWQTGMSIGFSPVWINAGQCTSHFLMRFAVKQTADMHAAGSAQKLIRLRCGNNLVGTFESKPNTHPNAAGAPYQIIWFWDHVGRSNAFTLNGNTVSHPADGQWHIYELEVDYRSDPFLVTFWLDGVQFRQIQRPAAGAAPMTGVFQISPFNEMYSCGQSGCTTTINIGDYIVDDFTLTPL